MKKWFVLGMFFIVTYVIFLVVTLPLNVVMNYVLLPKNITVQGLSGSVWQGQLDQIQVADSQINQVKIELSPFSFLMLTPKVHLTFGDAFLSGPEGKTTIAVSQDSIELTEMEILLSANDIAQQLTLPLPVIANGDVSIIIDELIASQSASTKCLKASGDIHWLKASVTALDQKISLGDLKAKLSCEKDRLTLNINPKNSLGLSFKGYLKENGKVAGNGYLKPGAKFPNKLKSVLPFLGNKDNQGRYQLKI